ncbi:MAG: ATP-binding protein, partial [Dokdonella sp.]
LKDFSRVDQAEWQQVNVHDCIDSTLNVISHELKYKADVVKEYGHLPPIKCFPFQIEQVIMNLLVNAAQAIEGHGTVTIRTGRDGDTVWVSISDTGKGIAPANLDRIFEPFFTTKPVGVGTGLGLSVSFGLIQNHGGVIEVTSELGSGTTFTIRLPIAQIHDTTGCATTPE